MRNLLHILLFVAAIALVAIAAVAICAGLIAMIFSGGLLALVGGTLFVIFGVLVSIALHHLSANSHPRFWRAR